MGLCRAEGAAGATTPSPTHRLTDVLSVRDLPAMVRGTRCRWEGTDLYVVVRGWAIPPYKVGRRFGPGTPHEADMVKIKTTGEAA